MTDAPVFRRPNWTTGMLLSPWHLLQQDAAMAIAATWQLRHMRAEFGLVGPGLRRGHDRGHPAYDPTLTVADNGQTVEVALSFARAITPDGTPMEVMDAPVHGSFPRSALATVPSVLVHAVIGDEDEEVQSSVGIDESNPTMAAFRRPKVTLRLDLPADLASRAVVVGRLRRATNTDGFQPDPTFIPASVSMVAHSVLYLGWDRIKSDAANLAGAYADIHRTIARFIEELNRRVIEGRPVDVKPDLEVLSFVERSVLALDACAYDTIDPSVTPAQFFSAIDRTSRRVALALDLSPATRSYFGLLAQSDTSYGALVDEEIVLSGQRASASYDDLAHSLERAERSLRNLRQLLHALSGKYLDYRINPAVEALRFLIDDNGEKFFVAVAAPAHAHREGDMLTFPFNQLTLPGGHEYRAVLVGSDGATDFVVDDVLNVTVRLNSSMGQGRPLSKAIRCELPGQKNFSMDFAPPNDIGTIASVDVSVSPGSRIRGCVLFRRRRDLRVDTAAGGAPGHRTSTPQPPNAGYEQRSSTRPTPSPGGIVIRPKKPGQS